MDAHTTDFEITTDVRWVIGPLVEAVDSGDYWLFPLAGRVADEIERRYYSSPGAGWERWRGVTHFGPLNVAAGRKDRLPAAQLERIIHELTGVPGKVADAQDMIVILHDPPTAAEYQGLAAFYLVLALGRAAQEAESDARKGKRNGK